jgi:hypothetical protein
MIEKQLNYSSRELKIFEDTHHQEGYSVHLRTIMSDTKQEHEDF